MANHELETPGEPSHFDVFLSYNGLDRPEVTRIAEQLRRSGLNPWFDEWHAKQGTQFFESLASGLAASSACAYFIGPHGEGNWTRMELAVALSRAAADPSFRLIPVLLPGLPEPFERTTLPPFLAQRTWVDMRTGLGRRMLQMLANAIKGVPTGIPEPTPSRDASTAPYKGLLAFGEQDAGLFFGREADVQRLLEKMRGSRFLAVLGPSGSGKSSLVRAGLMPALRDGALPGSDEWLIQALRPGPLPLTSLAAALASVLERPAGKVLDELDEDERTVHLATEGVLFSRNSSARLCWVIDQAEEVFTVCHDENERADFLRALGYAAAIPGGRTYVVLTLRADFYPRLAAYPQLAALVADSQYLVSPLDTEGLRAAVEQPAMRTGLQFEEGLVDTILNDVVGRPGVMPLMEHALYEVWQRRRGVMLTLEGYRESGGVDGALAKRAEMSYESFNDDEKEVVRRSLLRLTEPGSGTEDTRRRAPLSELITTADEEPMVETVLNRLADSRLITLSRTPEATDSWVDLSHEALIRGWPRMREWIEESREALRVQRRVTEAAADWDSSGRDPDLLYRGARLAEAAEWRTSHEADMNPLERGFLDASGDERTRAAAARDRRRRVLLSVSFGLAGVFLVLAVIAGLSWLTAEDESRAAISAQATAEVAAATADQERNNAIAQQQLAEEQRGIAEQQRQLAEEQTTLATASRNLALSRQHSAQALNNLSSTDLSLLLSAAAFQEADTTEARQSLLAGLTSDPRVDHYIRFGERIEAGAVSPDGTVFVAATADNFLSISHATARFPDGPNVAQVDSIETVAFSPDGQTVAAGSAKGDVFLWAVDGAADPQRLATDTQYVRDLAFTPDGATLIVPDMSDSDGDGEADGGGVVLWDIDKAQVITRLVPDETCDVVAVSPDGSTMAASCLRPGVGSDLRLWDLGTLEPLHVLSRYYAVAADGTRFEASIYEMVFAPDGKQVAAAADGGVVLWDARTGKITSNFQIPGAEVHALAFSRDGGHLASADGSQVRLWDVATSKQIGETIGGHTDEIASVDFLGATDTFISSSLDGSAIVYEPDAPPRLGTLISTDHGVLSVNFSADGSKLGALFVDSGDAAEWDVKSHQLLGTITDDVAFRPSGFAISDDGRLMADVYTDFSKFGSKPLPTTIALREVATGATVASFDSPAPPINIAFIQDDAPIVVTLGITDAGPDDPPSQGPLEVWDLRSGQLLANLGEYSVAAASSHGYIAAIDGNHLRIWNGTNELPGIDLGLAGWTLGYSGALSFSGDGKLLYLQQNAGGGPVTSFDVATAKPLWSLVADLGYFYGAGDLLAVPDRTGAVTLWDTRTGQAIGALPGQFGDSDFSPDGGTLATAGDHGITLWDVNPRSWATRACTFAGRNLVPPEWDQWFRDEPERDICPGN